MSTFVLVHGAFHGGWCWRLLTPLLHDAGHRVLAPTLTGLGERSHLLGPDVGLDTHVEDVIQVLRFEDVDDAVLVGHSYGAMVIAGVADRVPERVVGLVYLDGPVPVDGERAVDVHPMGRTLAVGLEQIGGVPVVPVPTAERLGIEDPERRAWVERHLTPHPHRCSITPLALGGAHLEPPRTFVLCGPDAAPDRAYLQRVVADPAFELVHLDVGHDCMVAAPERLAAVLLAVRRAPARD